VLHLVNLTFTEIYGFWPYREDEMDDFANRFLYLIDSRYIKVIVNREEEAVAFIVGMDDMSEGIRRARGRLLPFGWVHLLLAARRSRQLNLMLGAIHPDYQGRGLDMLMGARMLASARTTGKTVMDSHLELESNTKVRAEMERMGGKVYKRFTIFAKGL
jgi:GNAT superfamily N-acetyltransferase